MVVQNRYFTEIPSGGDTGEILSKASSKDHDVKWAMPYKFEPVLLWENPNSSGSFAAQTIAIPELKDYDFFLVGYRAYQGDWKGLNTVSPTFLIYTKGKHTMSAAVNDFEHRNFTINDDSVVFEGSYYITSMAGQTLTSTDVFCIPHAIYGLK